MLTFNSHIRCVTAFAPATCGNVIVGFDILGLAICGLGDEVTLSPRHDLDIVIQTIDSHDSLPLDPNQNIASAVVSKACRELGCPYGFDIKIKKGIPLSSGLGGSAASAVAALTAFNQFLQTPLSLEQLAAYALQGEALASGQGHADNIAPALYGGITLITASAPLQIINLPQPQLLCVLAHPHLQLPTRTARQALASTVPLTQCTEQSIYLASFISALYENNIERLKSCLKDVIIEPQRAHLIPGFMAVKHAALTQGAIGVSLSGAGPTLLAFAQDQQRADTIAQAMQTTFEQHGITCDTHLSPINPQGAQVVTIKEQSHAIS